MDDNLFLCRVFANMWATITCQAQSRVCFAPLWSRITKCSFKVRSGLFGGDCKGVAGKVSHFKLQ